MMSISACCLRGLRAVKHISSTGVYARASSRPSVVWRQQHAHRALSSVSSRVVEGGVVGEQIDVLLNRVEEQWSFIQDPEHLRGVLPALRHCKVLDRLLPRGNAVTGGPAERSIAHNIHTDIFILYVCNMLWETKANKCKAPGKKSFEPETNNAQLKLTLILSNGHNECITSTISTMRIN